MLGMLAAVLMDGPITTPPGITAPSWAHKPTGDDIARVYPPKAIRENLDAKTAMDCGVGDDGGLVDCKVVSEDPADAGFAEATLKLAPLFRLQPRTRDGRPVGGGKINIPITFLLPTGNRVSDVVISRPDVANGVATLDCRAAHQSVDNCVLVRDEPSSPAAADLAMQIAPKIPTKLAGPVRFRVKFVFKQGDLPAKR